MNASPRRRRSTYAALLGYDPDSTHEFPVTGLLTTQMPVANSGNVFLNVDLRRLPRSRPTGGLQKRLYISCQMPTGSISPNTLRLRDNIFLHTRWGGGSYKGLSKCPRTGKFIPDHIWLKEQNKAITPEHWTIYENEVFEESIFLFNHFEKVIFKNCDFRGSLLRYCYFTDCEMDKATLASILHEPCSPLNKEYSKKRTEGVPELPHRLDFFVTEHAGRCPLFSIKTKKIWDGTRQNLVYDNRPNELPCHPNRMMEIANADRLNARIAHISFLEPYLYAPAMQEDEGRGATQNLAQLVQKCSAPEFRTAYIDYRETRFEDHDSPTPALAPTPDEPEYNWSAELKAITEASKYLSFLAKKDRLPNDDHMSMFTSPEYFEEYISQAHQSPADRQSMRLFLTGPGRHTVGMVEWIYRPGAHVLIDDGRRLSTPQRRNTSPKSYRLATVREQAEAAEWVSDPMNGIRPIHAPANERPRIVPEFAEFDNMIGDWVQKETTSNNRQPNYVLTSAVNWLRKTRAELNKST